MLYLVPLFLLVGVVSLFLVVCFPFVLLQGTATIQSNGCRYFANLCVVLFWPCIGGFMVVLFLVVLCLYPVFRNHYHHGIYDPLDTALAFMSVKYSQLLHCVVGT